MPDLTAPEFDAAGCERCEVVLRDHEGGLRCPSCGTVTPAATVAPPPVFDGPDLDDWR